jgi:hypothetical protein
MCRSIGIARELSEITGRPQCAETGRSSIAVMSAGFTPFRSFVAAQVGRLRLTVAFA